ncbi:MAG: squalene synthase HpnD [Betaproteobacteria bacterium]|nr:squalene synthase HpnD [Betaproteobacteria bacterium]
MSPEAYCREKAAASGSSFYYSFLYLRDPMRAAMMALYAFCREVDDVVDECSEADIAARKLDWWEQEIQAMSQNQASHPVTLALGPHVERLQLPIGRFRAILDGMRMDLMVRRYPDEAAVWVYFDRVAGAVGQLAARIFQASSKAWIEPLDDYAIALGRGLQWINIIRDVGEDSRRGRLYLPQSWLIEAGLSESKLLRSEFDPALALVLGRAAGAARASMQKAFDLLPPEAYRSQRPGLIMAAIYHDLLQCIEAEGFAVMHQRIAITPLRKLYLAWITWLKAKPPGLHKAR